MTRWVDGAYDQSDEDDSFANELADDGHLDTAPRDYFGMAVIDVLMPGRPTVQDGLIDDQQERWHWPLNGSSEEYQEAFEKAWEKAIAKHRQSR